jgi:hypothetical protein
MIIYDGSDDADNDDDNDNGDDYDHCNDDCNDMVMNYLNFMGVWLFSNNILTLKSVIQWNFIHSNYFIRCKACSLLRPL